MTRDVRVQYVLTFGALGAVLPYASVFFRDAGWTDAQVGLAYAIWSITAIAVPLVVTMVADSDADPRRLLAVSCAVTAVSLLSLGRVHGVGPMLLVWTCYCVGSMPILPLQDGIHFSQQRRRLERGASAEVPYHRVRAWGTVGYIVPSVVLLAFLNRGMPLRYMLATGAAYAGAAGVQALRLGDPRSHAPRAQRNGAADRRVPTLAAAAALLRPHLLVLCCAVLLMQMAGTFHSAFYPIYLTERVQLSQVWLGHASNLAVFIEAFVIFGSGHLVRAIGTKWLLVGAMAITALRFALIALSADPRIAIGTQVLHGLLVLSIGVLPQIVLNAQAQDTFRHSMQGMLVLLSGGAKGLAGLISGQLAAHSLPELFGFGAALCLAAAVLILFGFHEPGPLREAPPGGDAGADPVAGRADAAAGPSPSGVAVLDLSDTQSA